MVYATADGGGRKRIRYGMVGGGRGAFIGAVHRFAARLDDLYVLEAGALSAEPQKTRLSRLDLGPPPQRVYGPPHGNAARQAAPPHRNQGRLHLTAQPP